MQATTAELRRPPFAFAKRHGLIVASELGDAVELVCKSGVSLDSIQEVRRFLRRPVRLRTVPPEEFDALLQRTYEGQTGASAALADGLTEDQADLDSLSAALAEAQDLLESDDDAPIIKFINGLLVEAIKENASDIHIETFESRITVRFRVDGVLREVLSPPRSLAPKIVSRVKIMAKLDIAEKRLPQDGRISRAFGGRKVDVRVSTIPTGTNSERVVMRILDKQAERLDLEHLGIDEVQIATLRRIIHRPYGIMLVTGPTGSGKTTTLYSSLRQLATPQVNVCTIEDPIEMVDPAFNQMQVQSNIDLNFAEGIRALMRQDPDIIMVGEIRDLETAEVAVQAALTGHLVLSTLHTNDAPSAVTRLLDLGVPSFMIKAVVIGVVAQRLVRRLCPHCKHPIELDPDRWYDITGGAPMLPPENAFEPVGCLECRETGYLGRVGIYEIMPLSATLTAQIHDQTDGAALRSQAIREGMTPLRLAGCRKIAEGLTSVEEVLGAAGLERA